jgi:DNA ligase 1
MASGHRPESWPPLVNIGKAYSGLTDEEIRRFTGYFLQHTIEDQGFRRRVEPTVVLEVAFNNIQRSPRHESGYALRFPRIVRLRTDKPADEVDTLERVKQLHDKQATGRASESWHFFGGIWTYEWWSCSSVVSS